MNIIFCLFGVIPRSIKKTWNSINSNIINILKEKNINVDIYVFNLNVENTLVDDILLNQNDIKIIPYTYFEEEKQSHVDKIIKQKCISGCKFRGDYNDNTTQNAMRQLYSEYRIGKFIEQINNIKKYDLAFVCGPDYYIANKIKITDVLDSYNNNFLYTSQVNNADGITNGFYFGKIPDMVKLLKRYNDFESSNKDYEYTVLKAITNYNIRHKFCDVIHFKVRANCNIQWQGGKKTNFVNKNDAEKVKLEYSILKKKCNKDEFSQFGKKIFIKSIVIVVIVAILVVIVAILVNKLCKH